MMHANLHDFVAQPYILCCTFAVKRDRLEGGNGSSTHLNSYSILNLWISVYKNIFFLTNWSLFIYCYFLLLFIDQNYDQLLTINYTILINIYTKNNYEILQ